ncbi:MoaD/ThiS family protein [Haloferula sp. BvORR071]|uniref:MoaD/ThiS family protein n=1 Tax=Haloferula sp. BvORR071 TaxID=1396141 RepID=UPI00054D7765|nr:MoaD/ThiS family protein [Haloferula sp. BvORR071]
MTLTVLAFAQARDHLGSSSREIEFDPAETTGAVVQRLLPDANLSDWRVALDCEFTTWDAPLGNARELAIIPPVSGG